MADPVPEAADAGGSSAAIEARGLVKRFGETTALAGFTLRVERGELFGLIGPDGAGKTTAIRALAGLIVQDAGEARVLGEDPLKAAASVREAIGLMPQQYSLYRDLSVAENLRFFGWLQGLTRADYRERARRLLDLTRLAPFLERRADQLSGGMYKKLALACALLHEPRVLLLDEPTNGVDPVSRRELWSLLHEFVTSGMTVLISTPYMDEAERCDRVAMMHLGKIVVEGPPRALLEQFRQPTFEALFLARLPEVR